MSVPDLRIRALNETSVNAKGSYVLYWMTAFRRTQYNFALDHAADLCQKLGKPLVVFEPLRAGYKWASVRHHTFVMQGMQDNKAALHKAGITYYPYIEAKHGDGSGLLEDLAQEACAIVSDDYPCFFLPRMFDAVAPRLPVRFELVDSNGLLPLRATDKTYPTAYAFRRFLQKELPHHLMVQPKATPPKADVVKGANIKERITKRWPMATDAVLSASSAELSKLDIDQNVGPADFEGGHIAGRKQLELFLEERLHSYAEDRNHPDREGASELSPYLHFGHVSVHEMFIKLTEQEHWDMAHLSSQTRGSREGWWGMQPCAEAFLDEIITWREVGYNMSAHRKDYAEYSSLPDWAKKTLAEHADDPREERYTLKEFERAETQDPLWNAAQMQLVRHGRLHNYMRMLWGKKILQWSETPQEAIKILIELNNKYGVDGRDPNSYSGIFWCLGRFDRPWPERAIFGKIRYMTSDSTRRKYNVKSYVEKYS